MITAERFSGQMFGVAWSVVWHQRLPELAATAVSTLGPLLLPAGFGLVVMLRSRLRVAVMTLAWVLVTTVFVLGYRVNDWSTMLLPVCILLALWAVVGLDQLTRALHNPGRVLAVLLAVALPVTAWATGYQQADRSMIDYQPDVDAAIAAVPDDSIIFTVNNGTRHLFSYRLLPDGLGARRNVWVSRGQGGSYRHHPLTYRIREYCKPTPEPWVWARQERAVAPSVARGLHTYVFGTRYAHQVKADGIQVTNVTGKLYKVECPTPDPKAPPAR